MSDVKKFPRIIPQDISNLSKEEELLYKSYRNQIVFGKLFDPGNFTKSETPEFHREITQELARKTTEPLALILPRGHAKALRIDEKVVTPDGNIPIKDINVGNSVYGSDGTPKTVVTKSDVMYKQMYRVTLGDGRSLEVSGDHLWTVTAWEESTQTYTTEEMLDLKWKKKRYNERYDTYTEECVFKIDNPEPLQYPEKDFTIDPYTLGVILGGGSLTTSDTPRVTCHEENIDEIMSYIPYKTNYHDRNDRAPDFSILDFGHLVDNLDIRETSNDKYIPKQYFTGSIDQRLDLLRGLMDTDGCLATETSKGLKVYFDSDSKQLANGVVKLVRSLGGSAKKRFHNNDHAGCYNVAIKIGMNPFRLERKAKRFKPHDKLFNYITEIEKLEKDKCQCIQVDSRDSLFIANNYTLTHNTTIMKNYILKRVCFARKAYEWGWQDRPEELFIGWVSDSQSKSKNNIRYIKQHIARNDKIKHYFGNLMGDIWKKEDLSLSNGCRILSRSNLTSLRGETQTSLDSGELRYSLVVADDVENEDNVKTERARKNLSDTIMNGIFPAIDNHTGRMIFIGTPIHKLSFTQKILDGWEEAKDNDRLDEYTWKVISYSATQPDRPGGVLWPSYISKEMLDQKKEKFKDSPRGISGYYQEYELQVQSEQDSYWNQQHVNYWEGDIKFDDDYNTYLVNRYPDEVETIPVNLFIGVDPATDADSYGTDYSVIMLIAMDYKKRIYVVDYIMRRSIPSRGIKDENNNLLPDARKGVVDYIFDYLDKYTVQGVTVEDVGMNKSVFNDYKQEQESRNDYSMALTRQKTGNRNKKNRIYSWCNSYFTSSKVYIKAGMAELEGQIIQFGANMGHDDVIDAFSYAIRRAYPPNAKEDEGQVSHKTKKKKAKPWTHA